MAKPLIIVESPTKAKTIKKFLPPRFVVKASVGHVRDLPKSTLGVDVEHDFAPKYLTIKGKGDVIKELKAAAKSASERLPRDRPRPRRRGDRVAPRRAPEARRSRSGSSSTRSPRTRRSRAIADPHHIDMPRVNAQQARRILDRLVGYKISPLLWAKVRGGLSAGRVQSVAVRLIVDREREILAFVPREYWTITARLASARQRQRCRSCSRPSWSRSTAPKPRSPTGRPRRRSSAAVQDAQWRVRSVKERETRRNPAAPFTTSTLQQEASRKLKFRVRKTMQIAQALYEGDRPRHSEGTQGLITYMRTDSTRIADSAREAAREFIDRRATASRSSARSASTGCARARKTRTKRSARPSVVPHPRHAGRRPQARRARLYRLIWERFVASQMAPALFDQTTVDIDVGDVYVPGDRERAEVRRLHPRLSRKAATRQPTDRPRGDAVDGKRQLLPKLTADEPLDLRAIEPKQHFTEPPPRYTEASLVRALEENGIGRPSTYSAIVETIQARGYVTRPNAASTRPRSARR